MYHEVIPLYRFQAEIIILNLWRFYHKILNESKYIHIA